jgi:ABC-type transport system involved in multi-copper enzyme maturation permease subunit
MNVIISEWTKLRATRSNVWTLVIAAIATIGVTAIVAHALGAARVAPPAGGPFTPLTASFLGYAEYAVLPVSILGVLAFTTEYSTGLIRTTFTCVPRRRVVLAAKAAVTGAAALVAGEVLAFITFFLTQAMLAGDHRGVSLSHPGALRAVLAAGLLLTVAALTGLGLGAIIRHTAGAIAATVGVIYLITALCLVLPAPWNTRIGRFTLPMAAFQLITGQPRADLLAPWLSLLVVLAWPAAGLAAAAVLITRRDV